MQATVHGVTKSQTRLSDSTFIYIYIHFFHILFHYGLSQDIEHSFLSCTVNNSNTASSRRLLRGSEIFLGSKGLRFSS